MEQTAGIADALAAAAQPGVPVIAARGLVKRYVMGSYLSQNEVWALKGVDVEVDRGEFVSIMGPSGSGKSTLLYCLGCLDRPTKGEVWVHGQPTTDLDDPALSRLRNRTFGFVFQTFHLLPRLTALQNVMLPLRYAGTPQEVARRRGEELLQAVGLSVRAGHHPPELSGGERQRVAIARALANRPSVVLADEPTGNLDSRSGREVMELLRRLNETGVSIVLVTHDEEVATYGQRTIRLRDGKVEGEDLCAL